MRAVIPAAGLGRRLRPVTEAVPKEMFPVGRYPAIEWVVAEAAASGCREVAVVISTRKRVIRDYLMASPEVRSAGIALTFIVQPEARGLGHALLLAREFCGREPFAVCMPDDLVADRPLPLVQLAAPFASVGGAIGVVTEEPAAHAGRYGRLHLRAVGEHLYRVEAIGEREKADGDGPVLVGVGRCICSNVFLDHAARLWEPSVPGEFDDATILRHMLRLGEPVHVLQIPGPRYDISTADGYVGAWQRFGMEAPQWLSR